MLRNHLYYHLKPFIPRAVRLGIRRWFVNRRRETVRDVWPILPGSERKPDGWPNWPEGKQFAFVLTHDIEGQRGVDHVRQLAELEMALGFRSSFNFIPEGEYTVPPALRSWLIENGFEVGVHDLHHDGRLYSSREAFRRKAKKINDYLKDWKAVGFRSGFMLRRLDWMHDIEILYDSSTFDTDPFEPEPEESHTIFPYWVSRIDGAEKPAPNQKPGYVELPYTLPQDSTMFLLLREKSPEIWQQKLEWIARHGGMALVNVHPDYLQFDGESGSSSTYPVAYYREFLEQLKKQHAGKYWQALPKDVAQYVSKLPHRPIARRPRRVCMVSHSFYESDNRVTRYAEALAARGDQVDVFALRRSEELPREEIINGVRLFRIQDRFGKTERSKFAYLWPLLRFLKASSHSLNKRHKHHAYDLLHVHNVPDFLVFSSWYPKLHGTRVILDIHDIVPEFFASKFGIPPKGLTYTMLRWMERTSAAFANHVIIANHLWLDKYESRTQTKGRCTAFINNVDSSVFKPRARTRKDDKLVILFPGGLQWHQGVDIAIRALKKVRVELPNAEFHIYGDGNAKESLVQLASELGLKEHVRFFNTMSVREIAGVMAEADLGVVPKRADSFGNEAYSTKIMEFMSVGVPVVISNTKVDRYYFNDSVVRFFESGNPDSLAREIVDVLKNKEARQQMVARASDYADRNCWNNRKRDYLGLVDELIETRSAASEHGTRQNQENIADISRGNCSVNPSPIPTQSGPIGSATGNNVGPGIVSSATTPAGASKS